MNLQLKVQKTETVSRTIATVPADSEAILSASEVRAFEANNIRRALQLAGGKIYGPGGAAELLDLKPTTLASRIKSLGIAAKP